MPMDGKRVSAWRNNKTSPLACARATIHLARPAALRRDHLNAELAAISAVPILAAAIDNDGFVRLQPPSACKSQRWISLR